MRLLVCESKRWWAKSSFNLIKTTDETKLCFTRCLIISHLLRLHCSHFSWIFSINSSMDEPFKLISHAWATHVTQGNHVLAHVNRNCPRHPCTKSNQNRCNYDKRLCAIQMHLHIIYSNDKYNLIVIIIITLFDNAKNIKEKWGESQNRIPFAASFRWKNRFDRD